ncbi:hypothetical protein LguiA_016475 [Lonicera macranthoides]
MPLLFSRTSYATLRFLYLYRHFSPNSSSLGKMKPTNTNTNTADSSLRLQNVGADRTSHDVSEKPDLASVKEFPTLATSISLSKGKKRYKNDLLCEQEPKSDGDSVQPETPQKTIPSRHRIGSSTRTIFFEKCVHRRIHFLQSETPRRKIKHVAVGIGQEPVQLESPPTTDSTGKLDEWSLPTSFGKKIVPYSKRRAKFRCSYPPCRGEEQNSDCIDYHQVAEPFDICLPRNGEPVELKSSLPKKSKQNMVEIKNSVEESEQVLRPGMVLLKSYLTMSQQVQIVKTCQELGLGSGGFYQPGYHDGAKLRLQMMCLGKNWDPQTKYKEGRRKDGSEPPSIPDELAFLVKKALEDSNSLIKKRFGPISVENTIPSMTPDICIVNFYTTNGRLGLHQDCDESEGSLRQGLPVVSISVGDSAEFMYGDQRDVKKAEMVTLESGDVLIFGGNSRHIFHGVTSIFPNSAPHALFKETMLRPGRLNLTFRQY